MRLVKGWGWGMGWKEEKEMGGDRCVVSDPSPILLGLWVAVQRR